MTGILYCVSRILPLFLTSDANDFDWSQGARNASDHTMFWFEFYLHGIGNAEQCYERLEEILGVTLDHLLTCDCDDGCPNCTSRLITPYHVRNIELGEGQVESRRAAVVVLNSLLTGQSVEESFALLDAPRENRGQQFLPTVTGEPEQREPHVMPLSDRTRGLMLRKLERDQLTKQTLDHAIDLKPELGVPGEERDQVRAASEEEAQPKRPAINRASSPLSQKLRSKLGALSSEQDGAKRKRVASDKASGVAPAEQKEPKPTPSKEPLASRISKRVTGSPPAKPAAASPKSTPSDAGEIQSGDSVARRARKLKRKRKQ